MKHYRGNANDICQLPYRSIISKRRKSSRTYRWWKFLPFVCFMLYLCNMNNLYYVCVPVKHQWGVEDEILSGKHGIDRICDFPYWQIFYMKHCRGNANDICQLPYRSIISKHRKSSRTYRWRKFFPFRMFLYFICVTWIFILYVRALCTG